MSTAAKTSLKAPVAGKANLTSDSTGHLVYLASPYTHSDPAVQEARFHAVCRHAAGMMRGGVRVFSPIAHTHPIAVHGLPGDWDFWKEYDRGFIEMCAEVLVLMLPGWDQSKGVRAEIAIARELGKPVRYVDAG